MHTTPGTFFMFPVPAALCHDVGYSCRAQAFMLQRWGRGECQCLVEVRGPKSKQHQP